MAYLVLARKYRPQTFEEVVGQAHVTRTLSNAISGNRVAHAILFSGPRGTGKTTIARILAKAMNCEKGPAATPCNACRSCRDITAGRGVDVFEIDGASNNSVDQVRDLRDNLRYMPAHSRYKIYIIDEVHMLSVAAFNALLKTLEEPPAHILFFFATTEQDKIPITILSRCQRHDLKRIDAQAIVHQMDEICRRESLTVPSDTLWAIARQAGGSMRDALSLLDQVFVCVGSDVDEGYVMRLLGAMDRRVLHALSEATFARDLPRCLTLIADAFDNGHDLKRFYSNVLNHFRHLLLVKVDAPPALLQALSPDDLQALQRQAERVSLASIEQVYRLLFDAEPVVRRALQPRLAVEMVFFKIHQIPPALTIDELIQRIDALISDPALRSSPHIVETQAGYGHSATPAAGKTKADEDRDNRVDDKPAAGGQRTAAGEAKPSGDLFNDTAVWSRVVEAVSKKKPSVGAALSRLTPTSGSDQTLRVTLRENDFATNMVKKNQALIERVCHEQVGRAIDFSVTAGAGATALAETSKQRNDQLKRKLLNHPLVADAVDIFNGTIDEIKIK